MSRQTSNWVDRGDPVDAALARVLAVALAVPIDDPRLIEPVKIVYAQVEAAATEGDIARYVQSLLPEFARPMPDVETLRLFGTALWHIAKAGAMREAIISLRS